MQDTPILKADILLKMISKHMVVTFMLSLLLGFLQTRELEWWERTVIYQIHPRSFKDSDGNGVGDLMGIRQKLDYIKDLGVEVILIQRFYNSAGNEMGYDILDHMTVDPILGSIDDAARLIKAIHAKGLKVIVDFIPNHRSYKDIWFQLSETRVSPYTNFFIWSDANITDYRRTPPNNWLSVNGESAWTWSDKRQQYYYSAFGSKMPDLNLRNIKVASELERVLKFWLELGVDGFRVDAVKYLVESEQLINEPVIGPMTNGENNYYALNHTYTTGQPENIVITHKWRLLLMTYDRQDNNTRILCTDDSDTAENLEKYFGSYTYYNTQIPLYHGLIELTYSVNATTVQTIINDWVECELRPQSNSPNWMMTNHENKRVGTRMDPESVDTVNMLTLLLPGLAIVYYGTELGLEDSKLREDQSSYKNCTGGYYPASAPMIWDYTKNAGFTSHNTPWLPVNPQYWRDNVEAQLGAPNSHLKVFKRLMTLRNSTAFRHGSMNVYILNLWTFFIVRNVTASHANDFLVLVMNLGTEAQTINIKDRMALASQMPAHMIVHTSSVNSGFNTGDLVVLTDEDTRHHTSVLRPKSALVLVPKNGSSLLHSLEISFIAVSAILLLRWT